MVIQGIIRPPTEIRVVADRTAKFVAKNGRAFEQRILSSEKGKTPKFAFLTEASPFHAYYEDRIRFYEEGGVDEDTDEKKKADDNNEEEKKKDDNEEKPKEEKKVVIVETKQMKASAIDPVARALLTERHNIESFLEKKREEEKTKDKSDIPDLPIPSSFALASISSPSTATSTDLEIIKLVAQFTAINHHLSVQQNQQYKATSNFFQEISRLEWNNPTFGFLQPRHAHFAYFTALVDAYRRLLSIVDDLNGAIPSVNRLSEPSYTSILLNSKDDKVDIEKQSLQLAAYRAEYERYEREKAQSNQDEGADNVNISTLQSAHINWHDFVVVETIDFPADEIVVAVDHSVDAAAIQPPPPPPLPEEQPQEPEKDDDMDMSDSDNEGEKEYIKIDTSYQPRVVPTGTNTSKTVIDPISNKAIPIQNMEEHMRIQLLDPKWAEERQRFLEKQAESNLVKGTDIARNITSFVGKKRDDGDDMFGTFTNEEERNKFEDESKKRLEEANRIISLQQASAAPPPPPPPPLPSTTPTSLPIKRAYDMTQQQLEQPYLSAPLPPLPPPPPTMEHQEPLSKKPFYGSSTYIAASAAATTTIDPNAATGMQMPPPPPPLPFEQSPQQKQLLSESEFLSLLPSTSITLILNLPPTTSSFNFQNRTKLTIPDFNVAKTTVKQLKQKVSSEFDVPANKLQIKFHNMFLKDSITLASVNCFGGEEYSLDVLPKVRGGRK